METSGTKLPRKGQVKKIGRVKKVHLLMRRIIATFALDSVKLSTVQRKEKREGDGKKVNWKTDLRPADTTIHTREEGPTVQLCGDNEVASKWVNGPCSLGQKYPQENPVLMLEKKDPQQLRFSLRSLHFVFTVLFIEQLDVAD